MRVYADRRILASTTRILAGQVTFLRHDTRTPVKNPGRKPVYCLMEDDFTVLLVNAAHVKHVPGRKTDTIDAAWLAQLLAQGLLSPSFVPPPPIRELRDLKRYRKALINERTAQVNRVHKDSARRRSQADHLRRRHFWAPRDGQ